MGLRDAVGSLIDNPEAAIAQAEKDVRTYIQLLPHVGCVVEEHPNVAFDETTSDTVFILRWPSEVALYDLSGTVVADRIGREGKQTFGWGIETEKVIWPFDTLVALCLVGTAVSMRSIVTYCRTQEHVTQVMCMVETFARGEVRRLEEDCPGVIATDPETHEAHVIPFKPTKLN